MLATKLMAKEKPLGASRSTDGRGEFLLWAPHADRVSVHLVGERNRVIPMDPVECGYFHASAEGLGPGAQYFFRLDDGRELPDPASRFQPQGVHGPSQVVETGAYEWTDQNWQGRTLEQSIFYELHVGTYTPEGTFDAVIPHLPELVELGATTIELMPVAQFPGGRNWGYDGVYPYAPQNSYGGPQGLARLVNAAHEQGLAVTLDVVYNHLGPEGNYLGAFGPYFTGRYRTPWGQAINFDAAHCDEVRRYFIENALYWLADYHFDALRLDAIHGIFDFGARHFLAELKCRVEELSQRVGRPLHIIAESDLNDARILGEPATGGYGIDAQWSDDFHHSVHTLLTGEKTGYYADFDGIEPLAVTLREGWYYSGRYSEFRKRCHGNSPRGISASHFVVCNQNHDQVGNRASGERLSSLVVFEALKLAAGITLLSPFVPMLFMGEEYAENAPFQYFTSHGDGELVEAVRNGRREEFAAFGWEERVPDPQEEATFAQSRLNHSLKAQEPHRTMLNFYQRLIHIRNEHGLGVRSRWSTREISGSSLLLLREKDSVQLAMLFNFAASPLKLDLPEISGHWTTLLHSAEAKWKGPENNFPAALGLKPPAEVLLSPQSFLVLKRTLSATESA